MTQQCITITHRGGMPLEHCGITFQREDEPGVRYVLTHYDTEDGRITWMHGYREVRFYASLLPGEVNPKDLEGLR